ncbi:MAG: exodeoxyribonuclease VII small subunit [Methylacidiphilales bacterium]|nr:exodeoxyribonuclease VII small subunit [Candidatus Methylacidiphilales bacterium]
MVKGKAGKKDEAWSYEEKVREIEEIIAKIEGGDLDLVDVFTQFATAVEGLKQCDRFLQERQQQVDLLIETLQDE